MKWSLVKPAMWPGLAVVGAVLAVPLATPMAAQRNKATRPQITRPDGPVWQVIRKNCTACHGIDDYAFYALDKAGWQALIETKHKDDGIALSAEDRNTLLDWLVMTFG